MRDLLTDLLDCLALILLAAGAGVAVLSWRHGLALLAAGGVLLVGSQIAERAGRST